jgi:hypothetical protein
MSKPLKLQVIERLELSSKMGGTGALVSSRET